MPPNPFIELARSPVATLAWLGYLLAMTGVVILAVPWAVRKTAWLVARYRIDRTSDTWWSFGEGNRGYIPPAGWLLNAAAVVFVLAVAAWAMGSLVWLVGG